MSLGDLCFTTGGALAYSKTGSALIYKGQWKITITWTGTFDSGHAFNAGTCNTTSATPLTSYEWQFEYDTQSGDAKRYKLLWSTVPLYVSYRYEPGYYYYIIIDTSPFTPTSGWEYWEIPANAILFYRSNGTAAYGFGIRAFSNSSSDPEAASSQTQNNDDYTCDIEDVAVNVIE